MPERAWSSLAKSHGLLDNTRAEPILISCLWETVFTSHGLNCRVTGFAAGPAPSKAFTRLEVNRPEKGEKMPNEEWIKILEDGRKVKFTNQELLEDSAFLTAQLEGNEVVYSIVLTKARNPLSRDEVEIRFKAELSKK
jgi:hypothetical protein